MKFNTLIEIFTGNRGNEIVFIKKNKWRDGRAV